MSQNNALLLVRDKAKRYSKLSSECEGWVGGVRNIVNNSSDESWGIFVVAAAVLEDAASPEEQDLVNHEIWLDEHEAELLKKTAEEKNKCRKVSAIAACVFCALGIALAFFLKANFFIDSFADEVAVFDVILNPMFNAVGIIICDLVCSGCAGFAIGSLVSKSNLSYHSLYFIACLIGFISAFICTAFPVIFLIPIWCAWHSTEISKFVASSVRSEFSIYEQQSGQRTFADNPKAPWFVKNAIRLAGKLFYSGDDKSEQVSHDALSTSQDEYGSFVVYNDVLMSYWEDAKNARGAEESARAAEETVLQNMMQEANENGVQNIFFGEEEQVEQNEEPMRRIDFVPLIYGVVAGIIVALALLFILNFGLASVVYDISQGNALNISLSSIVCFALLLVLCILAGLWSGYRASETLGLNSRQINIFSTVRSSWYSSWLVLILSAAYKLVLFSNMVLV